MTTADLRGRRIVTNMRSGSAVLGPWRICGIPRRAKRGTGKRAAAKRIRLERMQLLGIPETDRIQYRGHAPVMRNGWEKRFAAELLVQQRVGLVKAFAYEPMRFLIGWGAWYTPDFVVVTMMGEVRCYDVKGHRREAAIVRIKSAALQFPQFNWLLAKLVKGAWKVEAVEQRKCGN